MDGFSLKLQCNCIAIWPNTINPRSTAHDAKRFQCVIRTERFSPSIPSPHQAETLRQGLLQRRRRLGLIGRYHLYQYRFARRVKWGRASGFKHRDYGPDVPQANDEVLSAFMATFASPELFVPGIVVKTAPVRFSNWRNERACCHWQSRHSVGRKSSHVEKHF
jgi:hypothetical protein